MKFLVIHDRTEVADEIVAVIDGIFGTAAQTHRAKDMIEAREQLIDNYYDLAIVDLTLPFRHGKTEASLDTAELLLAEIFEAGDLRAPADVLGISLTPEVLSSIRTTIGEHLMGCLHEDPQDRWKADLQAKLRYTASARRHRRLVANSSYDYDVLIVTALDKEAKPYSDLFRPRPSDEFPKAMEFDFRCVAGSLRRGVLFSIGEAGQAACASATQALLSHFRPKLALMTGFCGGKGDRVSFGDAVAFKSSAAWDFGKWEERNTPEGKRTVFLPRPGALPIPIGKAKDAVRQLEGTYIADEETIAKAHTLSGARVTGWKFRRAVAGSGSAVVTSSEKLAEITDHDEDIWAVDMESYGFYHACLNTPVLSPDFLCLKSVADHCNGEKNSVYHAACSLISASIARLLITKHYDFG